MKIDKLTPESAVLSELGRRLARVRKQQGFTQTQLAEEAGIGVATLRRVEAGQDSQLETWIKLLRALGQSAALNALLPESFDSPMAEALADRGRRRRVRPASDVGLNWGDEQE